MVLHLSLMRSRISLKLAAARVTINYRAKILSILNQTFAYLQFDHLSRTMEAEEMQIRCGSPSATKIYRKTIAKFYIDVAALIA